METQAPEPRMVDYEDWDFVFVGDIKFSITVNLDNGDKVMPVPGQIEIILRDPETRKVFESTAIVMHNLLTYSRRERRGAYFDPKESPVACELARLRTLQEKQNEARLLARVSH